MAVIYDQTLPEGVPVEMLDEVTSEMGVDNDPPAGLILHTHFSENGRARIMDVWESKEAYEAFGQDRLRPAMQAVAERHGITLDGREPETTIHEVLRLVKG
jgi:hypothetical protein